MRVFPVLGLIGATLVSAAASPSAEAFVRRANCFSYGSAGDRGRQMGTRNATRIVNAVWNKLGRSCSQLDRLAQIISETPLARPTLGGEFAACFFMGYTDALWDQLDLTYTRCGTLCFNAGSEVGRISSEGYCAASIAVGGLDDPGFIRQPPLPFCGENLVMGCKAEYVQHATFDVPGCFAYTTGQFGLIFDNSVRQDCFVPSDVPIRDSGYFGRNSSSADEI